MCFSETRISGGACPPPGYGPIVDYVHLCRQFQSLSEEIYRNFTLRKTYFDEILGEKNATRWLADVKAEAKTFRKCDTPGQGRRWEKISGGADSFLGGGGTP